MAALKLKLIILTLFIATPHYISGDDDHTGSLFITDSTDGPIAVGTSEKHGVVSTEGLHSQSPSETTTSPIPTELVTTKTPAVPTSAEQSTTQVVPKTTQALPTTTHVKPETTHTRDQTTASTTPEIHTVTDSPTTENTTSPGDNLPRRAFGDAFGITIGVVLSIVVLCGVAYYIFLSVVGRPPIQGANRMDDDQEPLDTIHEASYDSSYPGGTNYSYEQSGDNDAANNDASKMENGRARSESNQQE